MAVQLLIRFFVGGMLVAVLPIVAQMAGPTAAGVLLLFPAVSFAGLMFLGVEQGLPIVARTSLTAVFALPTVLAFLLAVRLSASRGLPLAAVLAIGTASWFVVATPVVVLGRRRGI